MIGESLSHYRILEKLGAGGMGEVYRAEDTTLKRQVALKVLPPELAGSQERLERFQTEAESLAALDHPNIVTIYSVEEADGVHFLTMQLVEGKQLSELIPPQGVPLERALEIAVPLSAALAAAHEKGVIHRDLKPANIMVDNEGRVKVLDFGLAKRPVSTSAGEVEGPSLGLLSESPTLTAQMTEPGMVLGTMPYMSPEQAEGRIVDASSDQFSFGVVLYEMLSGIRPFQGDTWVSLASAITSQEPRALHSTRTDLPAELEQVVRRCLEKNSEARYASAGDLHSALGEIQSRLRAGEVGLVDRLRHRAVAIPLALLVVATLAIGGWLAQKNKRIKWARTVALPQIEDLIRDRNMVQAYILGREAERFIPDDSTLHRLIASTSWPLTIRTEPPVGEIYYRDYEDLEGDWIYLGTSPLVEALVPRTYLRWKIVKKGFHDAVRAPQFETEVLFHLLGEAESSEMAYVPGGLFSFGEAQSAELDEYWLDRYEVTNRQYKKFVDAGAYEEREHWDHAFIHDGQTLQWEEAMDLFVDTTGRAGPALWELGSYSEGQDEYPVSGVSWHEAAAYAKFVGRSLPTVYHWQNAAGFGFFSDILLLSNFEGEGPASVGAHEGLGPYGTYDMAGNVKEWCLNQSRDRRYILGGSWDEPSYMYQQDDARSPFERFETYGFRTMKYSAPLGEDLAAPIETLTFDLGSIEPVEDDVFEVFKGFHSYDPGDLEAEIESVDESERYWRRETVTFNAAYGGERILAYLMIPKDTAPPFQTVVFFPPGAAAELRSSETLSDGAFWDFLPRSGRAVMYPVYKGTYERGGGEPYSGPRAYRDKLLARSKDVSRSIDYLESRPDIDSDRLAYLAVSMGSSVAPLYLAGEDRLKTAVLAAVGYHPYMLKLPPEIQPWNYAPRVTMPVLMIGTRNDFLFPLETSQKPFFESLGTPMADKRHAVFEGGHIAPIKDGIREILDWLDQYLGPVD